MNEVRPLAGTPGRRGYLDWLRGVAVLIMIGGHTLDAWTLLSERARPGYGLAMMVAGIGAPIFLFLAGIALVLAAGGRMRRGETPEGAGAAVTRRAWQIFGLAFLFRLQSWVISGGPLTTLLKVDILNVMGLAMVGAALTWRAARLPAARAAALAGLAVLLAMLTPPVRATPLLDWLPDPVEWYLRPSPGRTTFTLLPWAGFLFAGAALGVVLDAARERCVVVALAFLGPGLALAGYGASFLPPIYADANFWTSSPTFFFLRLGILMALLPAAYAWERRPRGRGRREWLQEFGRASLFIYWIHVEMAYGVASSALHRRLTFEQALAAFAAFSAVLFAIAKAKDAIVASLRTRRDRSASRPARG